MTLKFMAVSTDAGSAAATFTAGNNGNDFVGYVSSAGAAALGGSAAGTISDPATAFGNIEALCHENASTDGYVAFSSFTGSPSSVTIGGDTYSLSLQGTLGGLEVFTATITTHLTVSQEYEWSVA